ncbi:glycosyltransferase family protein [Lichenifustis flavocetrariae]|uniref:Glycosyl transferase n=1 Tax=Lichenifustis flavocetrariae TaxID=2949735 RepID=A0AA41Z5B6_9HYPH|nr:glycosyltransferase [Lichenifustis flavocetrariae]MCW6510585.1 glycosyl transferase [Lichenifustis flavocetrariae]
MLEPHRETPRVVFYVQHLLGVGHLARAFRIAAALDEDGWSVDVLAGGVVPAGLDAGRATIVQLPPVSAGAAGMSALVHPDGRPFDADAQHARRDLLLAHVARCRPDVLLIEAFPFGRRQMRFELLPLLEAAKAQDTPPLIASSVRDIVQENRRPERIDETLDLIESYFDLVLVHGDPSFVRLDRSFPAAGTFAAKMAYTGLVAPKPPNVALGAHGRFDVVVSVGGGAVGESLLRAGLGARPLTRLAGRPWLFLTGPNLPAARRHEVERAAGAGVTVAPFASDLAAVLSTAAVSVSQAGYNTVADILVAGCRAVLVPYGANGETEQTVRAELLVQRKRAVIVEESALSPVRLAQAIDQALETSVDRPILDVEGARHTSDILRRAIRAR